MPEHYKIDPLHRWDQDEVLMLIAQKKYFVLHAPRQTGKTSCLLSLQDYLNAEGKYFAIYANFEAGQAGRNNLNEVIRCLVSEISKCIKNKALSDQLQTLSEKTVATDLLNSAFTLLSQTIEKPVVFLIDEIDASSDFCLFGKTANHPMKT